MKHVLLASVLTLVSSVGFCSGFQPVSQANRSDTILAIDQAAGQSSMPSMTCTLGDASGVWGYVHNAMTASNSVLSLNTDGQPLILVEAIDISVVDGISLQSGYRATITTTPDQSKIVSFKLEQISQSSERKNFGTISNPNVRTTIVNGGFTAICK